MWKTLDLPKGLGKDYVKGLSVTNIFKKTTFEVIWEELKGKTGFQRQSFTKYLRLTLSFLWKIAGKSLISISQEFFSSINKIFISAGTLGTRLSFYEV